MSMLGRIASDEFEVLTAMQLKIASALESTTMSEDSKMFLRGTSSAILDVVANSKLLDKMQRQESYESDPAWATGYHEGVSLAATTVNRMRKKRRMPAHGPGTLANYGMYAK